MLLYGRLKINSPTPNERGCCWGIRVQRVLVRKQVSGMAEIRGDSVSLKKMNTHIDYLKGQLKLSEWENRKSIEIDNDVLKRVIKDLEEALEHANWCQEELIPYIL